MNGPTLVWHGMVVREEWRDVPGWEKFYQVSNSGRVRTKHRIGRSARKGLLTLHPNSKGYLRVHLTDGVRSTTSVVHRLVLMAFVGPSPSPVHECNHKNGVKSDNRVENLEWVTPVENNAHSVSLGLWHPNIGEQHGRHKLSQSDIPLIRALEGKMTASAVGAQYGVSGAAITLIWRRINWKHIP